MSTTSRRQRTVTHVLAAVDFDGDTIGSLLAFPPGVSQQTNQAGSQQW